MLNIKALNTFAKNYLVSDLDNTYDFCFSSDSLIVCKIPLIDIHTYNNVHCIEQHLGSYAGRAAVWGLRYPLNSYIKYWVYCFEADAN